MSLEDSSAWTFSQRQNPIVKRMLERPCSAAKFDRSKWPAVSRRRTLYPMFGILGVTIRLLLSGFENTRFVTQSPLDRRPLRGIAEAAVARKAHACDRILADARRLVRTGRH